MSLSERDAQLALSVMDGPPPRRRRQRRRRCGWCGLLYPVDELHPDHDEDGRQIGFVCESCY